MLEWVCICWNFRSILVINKGVQGSRFGRHFGSSKNVPKSIGIRPQALISLFKPIMNNKSSKNTTTNTNKSKHRLIFSPYRASNDRNPACGSVWLQTFANGTFFRLYFRPDVFFRFKIIGNHRKSSGNHRKIIAKLWFVEICWLIIDQLSV